MTMRTVPLRRVPGDSIVHRLWAGTKLGVVLVVSLLLAFYPVPYVDVSNSSAFVSKCLNSAP